MDAISHNEPYRLIGASSLVRHDQNLDFASLNWPFRSFHLAPPYGDPYAVHLLRAQSAPLGGPVYRRTKVELFERGERSEESPRSWGFTDARCVRPCSALSLWSERHLCKRGRNWSPRRLLWKRFWKRTRRRHGSNGTPTSDSVSDSNGTVGGGEWTASTVSVGVIVSLPSEYAAPCLKKRAAQPPSRGKSVVFARGK